MTYKLLSSISNYSISIDCVLYQYTLSLFKWQLKSSWPQYCAFWSSGMWCNVKTNGICYSKILVTIIQFLGMFQCKHHSIKVKFCSCHKYIASAFWKLWFYCSLFQTHCMDLAAGWDLALVAFCNKFCMAMPDFPKFLYCLVHPMPQSETTPYF